MGGFVRQSLNTHDMAKNNEILETIPIGQVREILGRKVEIVRAYYPTSCLSMDIRPCVFSHGTACDLGGCEPAKCYRRYRDDDTSIVYVEPQKPQTHEQ